MAGKTERVPTWGDVTPEGVARLLPRIGMPRRGGSSLLGRGPAFRNGDLVVSEEFVRRYATGIADLNPLYIDQGYAGRSPWGRQLAPPPVLAWLEQVNGATEGFPGCHTIWRDCKIEWERPVFVGDVVRGTTFLRDVRLADSPFSGPSAVQDYETLCELADGQPIGRYVTSWHRFSRRDAKRVSRHGQVERARWTDEQLEALWTEYRGRNARRGARPLYWEEVEAANEIPYIIKGPITLTSKLAFESINFPGGWIVGHELALELWERHPALAIRNEENVPEPPVAIHWTNERCQRYLGMPAAYEAGYERLNWFAQLLMSWMGDHGTMRVLRMRFRGFHWQGDVIRLYGTVREKHVADGRHLVLVDLESRTQRDEVTTTGEATVQLPSRSGAPVWPS